MKYAIKRLTASDLTLFEWQFRNLDAGHQKAINLNADAFIDQMFPALPAAAPSSGRLPLDLYVYGPGAVAPLNLQRKVVKGTTYKNWRLNGEFIYNPESEPTRFNGLAPGDLAVFGFEGDIVPSTLHLVLVSSTGEQAIHTLLNAVLGRVPMLALTDHQLQGVLTADVPADHALRSLSGADLEDIASGTVDPTRTAVGRGMRKVSRDQLSRAREQADRIGRVGEEIVRAWLDAERQRGAVDEFDWLSNVNAVASSDFAVFVLGARRWVEVKSTSGSLSRAFHISAAEIEAAATATCPYDIVRVSDVDVIEGTGVIHVCRDVGDFARAVWTYCKQAPAHCFVDGVSIDPAALQFDLVGPYTASASADEI